MHKKQFCLIIFCALLLTACHQSETKYISIPTIADQVLPPTSTLNVPMPLKMFPLYKGASWTYIKTGYSQSGISPYLTIKGTTQIVESVVDVQSQSSFYIAHIEGNKSLLNADPGWEEHGTFGLGKYEFWYIVSRGGQIYLSYAPPDPQNILTNQLLQEYQFPMAKGSSWCPNKQQKEDLASPAKTPVPCASAGMRVVYEEGSYTTQAGKFDRCYRMDDDYNSGGVTQWLCNGVGIVAQIYGHAGGQFGYTQELIKFSPGLPE
jgi:hypothetical protein